MKIKVKHGLNLTPVDERDFAFGAITTLPDLNTLPSTFKIQTLGVKNQKDTDYCSAFSTCLASETQEGIPLSPEWSFAVSKKISGNANEPGQDLRTACTVHTNYGGLPQIFAPWSLNDHQDSFLRDINNWGKDLFGIAEPHKKKSYFKITGKYDSFDNIRATLFKNQAPLVIGLIWNWDLSDYLLVGTSTKGSGHAIAVIGWDDTGLILQNSYGLEAGNKGLHILPRQETNYYVTQFGAYTFVDLSVDEAKYYLAKNIKLEQVTFFTKLIKILHDLISVINNKEVAGIVEAVFAKREPDA